MKGLLICPAERPAVHVMAEVMPIALVPLAGKSMLEYWLEHLASLQADAVTVLASSQAARVREFVQTGTRWGLNVEVIDEVRELTSSSARKKYLVDSKEEWLPEPNDVIVMDHFPGLTNHQLFKDYAGTFSALKSWFPRSATLNRIGVREVQPGVWASVRARISSSAQLRGPCWIGENVRIGPRAIIGPMAVIEDRALIMADSKIVNSIVGPATMVGRLAHISDSIAWGNVLVDWKTNSTVTITDPFLLCALIPRHSKGTPSGWLGQIASLYSRNKEDFNVLWKHLLMKRKDKGIL
jgi:NDP-sugar pyrophosphorylase family protein